MLKLNSSVSVLFLKTVCLFCLLFLVLGISFRAFASNTEKDAIVTLVTKLHIPDNNTYLITPELYRILSKIREGEPIETASELERLVKEKPHIISNHFWAGTRLLLTRFADDKNTKYDKRISKHFNGCISRAKRAKKLDKFRHAGMYYEAMCNAGLGMFLISSEEYVDGGLHARDAVKLLFKLHKELPNHHGTLYAVGSYNYFTGRMGTLGKALLSLLMLPIGDKSLGLQQLRKSAEKGSPLDTTAKMTLAAALARHERKVDEAVKIAEEVVELVPENSGVYTFLADKYVLAGKMELAKKAIEMAQKFEPKDVLKSKSVEIRNRGHYTRLIRAVVYSLLYQDDKEIAVLYNYAKFDKNIPNHISLFAGLSLGHMYRLAGLQDKAFQIYEMVEDSDGPRGIRDRAEEYRKEHDIRSLIKMDEDKVKRLKKWLSIKKMPEVGSIED